MPGVAGDLKIIFRADSGDFTAQTRAMAKQLGDVETAATRAGRSGEAMGRIVGHTVPQYAAASGAIRILEGDIDNNVRAAERFVATTLRLGPALQVAFPLVGAIALGAVVVHLTERVIDFAKANEEAARKNEAAFRGVSSSLTAENDALRVTNDKLAESIAKFEHKPQNALKTAIDEALQSADALGRKLDEDLAKLGEALKGNDVGIWTQLFTGAASTADIGDKFQGLEDSIRQTTATGSAKVRELQAGNAKPGDIAAAQADLDNKLSVLYREGSEFADAVLKNASYAKSAQTNRAAGAIALARGAAPVALLYPMLATSGFNSQNMDARIRAATAMLSFFGGQQDSLSLSRDNAALTKQNDENDASKDAAAAAAKILAAELEKQMKAMGERIKLLVDTPTKEREYREKVFKSTLGAPTEPAGGFKDVAGEMDQDIGRYGPRWREYNDLIAKGATEQKKLQMQLALTKIRIEAATGAIGPHAAALAEAKERAGEYALNLETLQEELRGILSDQSLTSNERDTQAQRVRNQIGDLNGQNQIQAAQDQALIASTEALNEFREGLLRTADSWTNLGEVLANFTIRTLDSFNETLMKMLSTPANMMRGKHPWGDLGASVAKSAGTSALQYGEGEVMKLLFGHNPAAKLGTQGNPMWVKSADAAASAALNGVLGNIFASGSGTSSTAAGNATQSIVSTGLGVAMSAAGLPHFAMGGAIPSNMPAIVGENGAELWMPSNPGRIIPNGEFGGGGDTHVHVDARGNNDPAATNAAVHRAMQSYLPHLPRMAIAAQADRNNRLPSSRRSR